MVDLDGTLVSEDSKYNLVDDSEYNLVEESKYNLVDDSEYNLVEDSKYNLVDDSKYNLVLVSLLALLFFPSLLPHSIKWHGKASSLTSRSS